MNAISRNTFAIAVLTAIGVLPTPPQAANARSPLARLSPIELEQATIVAAVKQVPSEIRAGRLGH